MIADALLSKLEKVRQNGRSRWRACCPSCGGKNASKLSVTETDDGRVLIHCFSGCDVFQIVSAVGLELSDLYPDKPLPDGAKRIRKPWSARQVVEALRAEVMVAWVLLQDMGNGKVMTRSDRQRAKDAADRCAHLMQELTDAG